MIYLIQYLYNSRMEVLMMLYNLSELAPDRIAVQCLSFIRYVHLPLGHNIRRRGRTAFMYVAEGGFHYQFDGLELTLGRGDILYLPEGANYSYRILGYTECVQLETHVLVDGQPAAFSDRPVKLVNNLDSLRLLFNLLERDHAPLALNSAVFSFLAALTEAPNSLPAVSHRLLPAVRYLEAHYNDPLYMADVAALCHISQSQLRRLFQKELGISPIEYKNRLRMEKARHLLLYTYNTVSEIAASLGFDSVYVFSRIFRQYNGLSPSSFRKNHAK